MANKRFQGKLVNPFGVASVRWGAFGGMVAACLLVLVAVGQTTAIHPKKAAEPIHAATHVKPPVIRQGLVDFNAAEQAYQQGRYKEAMGLYETAAEHGHRGAIRKLASMYALGKGVQKSYAMAAMSIRPLAELDNGEAQSFLGALYMAGGYGLPQSNADAFEWFLRSAINGHADGQYMVGLMYLYGRGTAPNLYKAQFWFKKAATQGHRRALAMLKQIELASAREAESEEELSPPEDQTQQAVEEVLPRVEEQASPPSETTTYAEPVEAPAPSSADSESETSSPPAESEQDW